MSTNQQSMGSMGGLQSILSGLRGAGYGNSGGMPSSFDPNTFRTMPQPLDNPGITRGFQPFQGTPFGNMFSGQSMQGMTKPYQVPDQGSLGFAPPGDSYGQLNPASNPILRAPMSGSGSPMGQTSGIGQPSGVFAGPNNGTSIDLYRNPTSYEGSPLGWTGPYDSRYGRVNLVNGHQFDAQPLAQDPNGIDKAFSDYLQHYQIPLSQGSYFSGGPMNPAARGMPPAANPAMRGPGGLMSAPFNPLARTPFNPAAR